MSIFHKQLIPSQVSIMVVKEEEQLTHSPIKHRPLLQKVYKNPFNFRRASSHSRTDTIPSFITQRFGGEMLRSTITELSNRSIKTTRRHQDLKNIYMSPNTCDIASLLKMVREDDSIIDESEQHVDHPIYKFPLRKTITPNKIFHLGPQRTIKAPFTTAQKITSTAFPVRPKKCFKYKNLRLIWKETQACEKQPANRLHRRMSAPFL